MIRNILLSIMLLLCPFGMKAQKFFNLTADEVRIGEQLPCFTYSQKLGTQYADSTYLSLIHI
mgnify:FL=1